MAQSPYSLYRLMPLQRAAREIYALFASRSSVPIIAIRCLQRRLRAAYPSVAITDLAPVLLTPRYRYSDKAVISLGDRRLTLVDAVINRFIDGTWVDYTLGQRITDQPDSPAASVSALKIVDVQDAVNQCGRRLLEHCQQALIDDWAELSIEASSRFESLSLILKRTLKHLGIPTLITDPAQRKMIDEVLHTPDNNLRTGTTRAYLVDQWGEVGSERLEVLRGMVLIAPRDSGETILLFTLSSGIETLTSRAQLGAALRKRLTGLAPGRQMQWRLYEPRGNIFDGFALSFLIKQINDLKLGVQLGRDSSYWSSGLFQAVQRIATEDFDSLRVDDMPEMSKLYAVLPQWMKVANRDVRVAFSRGLQDLAQLFKQPNWRFFDDGVPSLLDFTRQRLKAAYPKASTLEPDDVIITVHTVMGVSAAGGFPVKLVTTLLRVALENLASLPGDAIEVSLSSGATPPAWLTPGFIKQLVSKVDVGQNYPSHVAAMLKDSPSEVRWRSRSFIDQLRVELPMLALEFHGRGQWGFSREGYETVAAVMQAQAEERYLGNEVIVLRPLAFKATSTSVADVVMNMFVIGPRALDAGPVVLFRPMAHPKLMQFTNAQALLTAIGQPGELQQQVLAWMSADARATYQGGGFIAPHFNTMDGLVLLIDALTSKPAMLASDEVQGDYGQHLYKSQVQAVLEQADRQSVSNRENLWARRMEGLSLGLNSVMPLVTGPLAVVGWLQVAWGVHEQFSQASQGGNEDLDSVLVGFCLNMALVLLHYSSDVVASTARRGDVEDERVGENLPETLSPGTPAPAGETATLQLPDMNAGADVSAVLTPVEYGWLPSFNRLTPSQIADLQTFSLEKPAAATRSSSGTTSGLWLSNGQWYADVDAYCFNVSVQRDGVRVVAANGRRGPWLKRDGRGSWVVDLRLRLSGGAPGEGNDSTTQTTELKARFDTLHAQFTGAKLPEASVITRIAVEVGLDTRLASIEREIDNVVLLHQRAKVLLDLLEQRRRMEVVHDYAALRQRYLVVQVQCLRFQVRLLEVRRTTHYQKVGNPASAYLLTLPEVARYKLSDTVREGLRSIARVHEQAVAVCREQLVAYQAVLDSVRPGDTQLSALDAPEWRGKTPILAWLEAGLRPMVLRCLKEKAEAPGMDALALLRDAHLRSRLRLSSYRQLCADPAYNATERRQILNETVDELAWLDVCLERAGAIRNDFIDQEGLNDYRAYLRAIRDECVEDVLQHYADQAVVRTPEPAASGRIIQSRHFGSLLATQREPSEGSPAGSSLMNQAEFVDPYTRVVFARFIKTEQNGESDWVYQAVRLAQADESIHNYVNSYQLLQRAHAAMERLPRLEHNTLLAPRTVRGDIELLVQELLDDVERSREGRKGSESRDPIKELLEKNLADKANELNKAAREAYQRMVLARDPTTTGLADLLGEGVVEIKEIQGSPRVPASDSPPLFRSFYIQKVKFGRSAPEVLWFAHFHYMAEQAGDPLAFYFGHLKRGNTPVASFSQRLQAVLGDNERLLTLYRSTIEREAAKPLFFSAEVTPTQ